MNRRLSILLCSVCLVALACEDEKTPAPYEPGGRYYRLLDASGRRHVVLDEDGKPLGKLRVREDALKVYDASMQVVGEVEWDDETVRIIPRGGAAVELTSPNVAVREVEGRFRLEMVEQGWALFDPDGQRLGYFSMPEKGRFALRDDYSAAPRVYAREGESEAKSPAGTSIVSTRPDFDRAPLLLPFAIEADLRTLDRVAIGVWLLQFYEPSTTVESSPDAG